VIYPIVRMYASAQQAADAASRLKRWGIPDDMISLVTASGTASAQQVVAAIKAAYVLQAHAEVYAAGVARGQALVAVRAPFGMGAMVAKLLDSAGAVESGVPSGPERGEAWDDAAPLSSALWLPVLTRQKPPFYTPFLLSDGGTTSATLGIPELRDSRSMLSSSVGMKLLSHGATPLSSLLRLPVLL